MTVIALLGTYDLPIISSVAGAQLRGGLFKFYIILLSI